MYKSADGRAVIGRVAHDFYSCRRCTRLITQPEMVRALGTTGTGTACPCGGTTYSPANLTWRGWLLPRVWAFACARIWELGPRGLWQNLWAPPPIETSSEPPPGVARL